MRIALVAPPWYTIPPERYGGIEMVVAGLADGLVAAGHSVILVAVGRTGTRAQTVLRSYPEPQSDRLQAALPEVVHAAFVHQALREVDVDLVHDHSTAGPLTATGRSIPTVVTAHNDVSGEFGRILRHLSGDVAPVAVSASQRRTAPDLDWAGVVHNGVEVDAYPFSDAKEDYVLFLGRMGADKGAHVAIDAARAAGRRIVLAAKCLEPTEHEYFAAQIEPRLGPDVEWLGEVDADRKTALLVGASALLFPVAWDEPFGLVMVEAMACGTPVVALHRGAVPEVVVDGVTGWVCDDPAGISRALGRLHELDPAACRAHVERRFSTRAMVSGYEKVYDEVQSGWVASVPRQHSRAGDRRGASPSRPRRLSRGHGSP